MSRSASSQGSCRTVAAVAATALLTSACAHDPLADPLFWEGVGLAADLAVVAILLDEDCRTRFDRHGRAYEVCGPPKDRRR